jgi:tetratricopeptide (TPR) repeat protein
MVTVRDETRMMMAYGEPAAEEMPMFAENRIHQRSSGNPYPNKVVMRVDHKHRAEKPFRVITLENQYLKIELMPELGGRIYSALDKRTGYDFFYKQHVIKPALIGLLGSWISGGCEFNWPCHHRPSTYMPVDVKIENHADGSVTVWMSENEPFDRMKGMVGVHLAPGEARFDTRMKVFNRSSARHSFLWWENVAVPVNEQYRLVFPPDVHYVQFHYRKSVTSYPVASGVYNGIRLGEGLDISHHKNTHQPTSYFCAPTKYDFFGGYDEGRRCGVVHVADRTTSVGKKMFTWAYNQLSRSWEKALTDADGAYAEMMVSSYSLNQPDFAWLMPYECKEFSQMWYPVGDGGAPMCACREASFCAEGGKLTVQATVALKGAKLTINGAEREISISPEAILALDLEGELESFTLKDAGGKTLLAYAKPEPALREMPETLPDNPTLDKLTTAQDLYLMGVHVEQYRDPAIRPDRYFREAIRRDPEYAPALTALAAYELAHFRIDSAYGLAMRAWKKLTMRNFHPESGELQYLIGRILEAMGKDEEAWDWHMQAAWAQDARSRAMTRAAMIEGRRGCHEAMLHCAEEALKAHCGNETAMLLKVIALYHIDPAKAETALQAAEAFDPLNVTCRALRHGASKALYTSMHSDARQSALDIAADLAEAGEKALAAKILANLPEKCAQTEYVRWRLTGDESALAAAQALDVGIAYPSRAIEYDALKAAAKAHPGDANAASLLACQLYAAENYAEAEALWAKAAKLNPDNYMNYRNLAVARYSHLNRRGEALGLMDEALKRRPRDGQLIWEKAHLMTRLGVDPEETIAFLKSANDDREDTAIELCRALNMAGHHEEALKVLSGINFTPCEGGEHSVAEQYMLAHHALGRRSLAKGDAAAAKAHFQAAQQLPDNLGAGLWNEVLKVPHQYFEAVCHQMLGDMAAAKALFDHILILKKDYFSNMNLPELPCFQAMAYLRTGRPAPAQQLLAQHLRAQQAAVEAVDAGYNKTTPFFISYMEDAQKLRKAAALWQMAAAHWAAGDVLKAATLAQESLADEPSNLYARLVAAAI